MRAKGQYSETRSTQSSQLHLLTLNLGTSICFWRIEMKTATIAFGLLVAFAQAASAAPTKLMTDGVVSNVFLECLNDGTATVYNQSKVDEKGWLYTSDSSKDGVDGYNIGGNKYEIYGSAIKETKDSIFVVLNSNMLLAGHNGTAARDGNIGWGDWFLNLSGTNFTTANANKNLFAVRFAGTNDSGATQVGLYGGVQAKSVTGENSGFGSLTAYQSHVNQYAGSSAANLGDLAMNTSYFDQSKSLNSIASGTFLSNISYLNMDQLKAAGYNSSQFSGSQTIAFQFDKAAVCQAGGNCQDVPEPTTLLGASIALFGMKKFGKRSRRTAA